VRSEEGGGKVFGVWGRRRERTKKRRKEDCGCRVDQGQELINRNLNEEEYKDGGGEKKDRGRSQRWTGGGIAQDETQKNKRSTSQEGFQTKWAVN